MLDNVITSSYIHRENPFGRRSLLASQVDVCIETEQKFGLQARGYTVLLNQLKKKKKVFRIELHLLFHQVDIETTRL